MQRLRAIDDRKLEELADVLIDCLEGGASVSFMQPLSRARAVTFWQGVAKSVAAGDRASRRLSPLELHIV